MTKPIQLKVVPFGMYQFIERLAIGGMAEVYLAYLAKTTDFGEAGDLVAVKRILPSIAESDEFIAMFIDEAKIAGQLHHKNIAPIYDIGKISNSYYLTMEYITGHDIRAIWDAQRYNDMEMNLPMACYLCQQICEGLDYAHHAKDASGNSLGIIHRDVSPQNILVHYEGKVKIIDFGIAKSSDRMVQTRAGILKGKFAYMAPEQAKGDLVDARADIFAIGVIFYELLTGHRAFKGATDFAILEKVRRVHIAPPRKYNNKITRSLEKILQRALARDVKKRYARAGDMADALKKVMQEEGWVFGEAELKKEMQYLFKDEIAAEKERQNTYRRFWLQENKVCRLDTLQAKVDVLSKHDLYTSNDSQQNTALKKEMLALGSIAEFDDDSREDETVLAGRGGHFGERPDTKKVSSSLLTYPSGEVSAKTQISNSKIIADREVSLSEINFSDVVSNQEGQNAASTFKALNSKFSQKKEGESSKVAVSQVVDQSFFEDVSSTLVLVLEGLQEFLEKRFDRNIDMKFIVAALFLLIIVIPLFFTIPLLFLSSSAQNIDGDSPYNVILSSEPARAKVLNGDIVLCMLTPCTLELPIGEHQLKFKMDGYIDLEKKVVVEKTEIVRVHLPLVKQKIEFKLKVEPEDAVLYLNNEKISSKNPLGLAYPKGTKLFMVLKKDGFETVTKQIIVDSPQEDLFFKLRKSQTLWKLAILPHDAIVHVEGVRSVVASDAEILVKDGFSKAVWIERPGCKSKLVSLKPNGKETSKKKIRLECGKRKLGALTVKSRSKLQFILNGIKIPKFRHLSKYKLAPGRYALSIRGRRSGKQVFIDIRSGKTTLIKTKVR